jgi:hypothetical protein
MYNVSNDYIDRIRALSRTDKITGTLTFSDGHTVDITESTIGSGSVSISRACIDGDELNFGAAMTSELSINLISDVNRYKFYGAKISLTYWLQLLDGSWFDVPLGVFNVSDATRTGKLVKLIAYDNISMFDLPFGETIVGGTPYQILKELCDLTGTVLGMTVEEFETIPNGLEVLQIDSTNGCKTLRDALKIVSQLLCGFAVADRDGTIKVKQFSKVSSRTLTERDRYNTSVEDFNCSYIAVQVTGLAGTYSATTKDIRDGLTLYMDDAPAWDYGLDNILQRRADSVMAYIDDFEYTPCDINMPGDPSFDCGDRITVSVNGELIDTVIMEIEWQFRSKMKVTSKGTNLFNLGTSETSNRVLSRESTTNKLEFYHYTNPDEIVINDSSNENICNIKIATVNSTSIMFFASIIFDVETTNIIEYVTDINTALILEDDSVIDVTGKTDIPKNCKLQFSYILNEIEEEYYPTYVVSNGKNTITLIYNIDGLQAQSSYEWVVKVKPTGGNLRIKDWNAKVTLFGQGLVEGDSAWDGKIRVEDIIENIGFKHNFNIVPIIPSVSGASQEETISSMTARFSTVRFNHKLSVAGMDSELVSNLVYRRDIVSPDFNVSPDGYNEYYVEDDVKFTQTTSYIFEGKEFTIDSGLAFVATTDTEQFLRVDDVEVV